VARVLRQLIALGHVRSEGEFNTLELTDSARAVLRGEVQLLLRVPAERRAAPRRKGARRWQRPQQGRQAAAAAAGRRRLARFAALKAWRAEVAKRAQPAGLRRLPRRHAGRDGAQAPDSLDALAGISGVGAKKLDAYGPGGGGAAG
jgi:ATP-dependent DNA helicase RecQ